MMDKYREQYSKLTMMLQARINLRETKKTTWIASTDYQITDVDSDELHKLFNQANLVRWDLFKSGTNNILKMGRAIHQLQREGNPSSKPIKQVEKAIKQIEKLLDTFSDETFPLDSLFTSYLLITDNDIADKPNSLQAKDIRTQLCSTVVALSMFLDDHATSKSKHIINFDDFIIELSRHFERHNGKVSTHSETHFYRFVSICMDAIRCTKADYEPIIEKALKQKRLIDGNNLTP
ncbi:MAG: hypothetical protein GJ671_00515 [Alteromonadaceae bacterium]|nr:hypothetical protein [Alteromonadaceae bacterium]